MAEILFPLAERVLATQADSPRAATPEQIEEVAAHTGAQVECLLTVEHALKRAGEVTKSGGVVVVTGSIYVVGEALQFLNPQRGRE
jgi:dihydrofolate synthase/folylpolyglutamate synthase